VVAHVERAIAIERGATREEARRLFRQGFPRAPGIRAAIQTDVRAARRGVDHGRRLASFAARRIEDHERNAEAFFVFRDLEAVDFAPSLRFVRALPQAALPRAEK